MSRFENYSLTRKYQYAIEFESVTQYIQAVNTSIPLTIQYGTHLI